VNFHSNFNLKYCWFKVRSAAKIPFKKLQNYKILMPQIKLGLSGTSKLRNICPYATKLGRDTSVHTLQSTGWDSSIHRVGQFSTYIWTIFWTIQHGSANRVPNCLWPGVWLPRDTPFTCTLYLCTAITAWGLGGKGQCLGHNNTVLKLMSKILWPRLFTFYVIVISQCPLQVGGVAQW